MLFLLLIVCGVQGLRSPDDHKLFMPHVETYYESWEAKHNHFASELRDVPASPLGSDRGVNVVNVAFATPNVTDDICLETGNCITDGLWYGLEIQDLEEGVAAIHSKGGYVKLSIGGEAYGNTGQGLNGENDIDLFVHRIAAVVERFDLDGVDLAQVNDCGAWSDCGLSGRQIEIIQALRTRLPYKIISYQFPTWGYSYSGSKLYDTVIENAHQYLDYVTPFGKDDLGTLDSMLALGVPKHKLVLGIWLTRTRTLFDEPDCSLAYVTEAALFIKEGGFGGVMTWSINSDSHRRYGHPYECNEYQTGHYDGTFVDTIANILSGGYQHE